MILKTLLVIMLCMFCIGCVGDSEYEEKALIEDDYGYSGTWLGQGGDNNFVVLNILRADENKKEVYVLTMSSYELLPYNNKIDKNNSKLKLNWKNDNNIFEAVGNAKTLKILANNGNKNIIMSVDGKNMTFNYDTATIKLKRMTDYDDYKNEAKNLKKKIEKNLREEINKSSDVELIITDNTKYLKKIIIP